MRISHDAGHYLAAQRQLRARVYSGDSLYRDSTTPLISMLLNPRGRFALGAELVPAVISEGRQQVTAAALLIHADGLPDVIQISFFEALPNHAAAVELLVNRARELAHDRGATRVVAGMNGHVNYGLGFLAGPYDSPSCFGSAYNPPYYIEYLRQHAVSEDTLVSYSYDVATFTLERERRILERASRRFCIRVARFNNLRAEISIYTELNNRCFETHPLYFARSPDEDYELFNSFRLFLKEENFLIAELDGQPVGFLLWYPDFNELIPPGGGMGLRTLLRYRVLRSRPSRFRLAELGVLPEYQGKGVILGLIGKCFQLTRGLFSTCESGWVLDSNRRSRGLADRWCNTPCKEYTVFEIDARGA